MRDQPTESAMAARTFEAGGKLPATTDAINATIAHSDSTATLRTQQARTNASLPFLRGGTAPLRRGERTKLRVRVNQE